MKEIYHNLKNYMLTALLVLSSSACGSHGNEQSGTDNSDTPAPSKTSFTQGADISWVSEMEKKGLKFYNHEGIETDCFQRAGHKCHPPARMGKSQRQMER